MSQRRGTAFTLIEMLLALTLTAMLLTIVSVTLGGALRDQQRLEAMQAAPGWFDRVVWPWFERTQHKLHPYVEKYGEWGLAVFIGVPLPGTGAYTGAFGAFLLGLDKRKFLVANALGVLIACAAVVALQRPAGRTPR